MPIVDAGPREAGIRASMGFAGELSTIGLAEVFQNVAFNRLTGTLAVTGREQRVSIHFDAGRVRLFSPGPGQAMEYPRIAAKAGAAPADIIAELAARRRKKTFRSALRQAGCLDEEIYDEAVADAIREEIIVLFSWRKASFVFEEGKPDELVFDREQRECSISLDPQGLAMEAARRIDEWASISRHIASEKEIFLPAEGVVAETLDEEVRPLAELLDGTRDIAGLVDALPHGKFHVMRLLTRLMDEGVVVRATSEHLRTCATQAQAGGDIHRAVRHLEAALEREDGDLETRRELARLYERAGRKEDAAREHKRLAFAQAEKGDLDAALEAYSRAAELLPHDTAALEKIAEIHDARGDRAAHLKAGRRLGEALVQSAMYEQALPVYKRLTQEDPQNASLRAALAAVFVKLHEPKKAASELLDLADACYARGSYEEALLQYRNALAIDRACTKAGERIEEIESGAVRARGLARRRRFFAVGLTLVLSLLTWQLAREWIGRGALIEAGSAARTGLAAGRRVPAQTVLRAYIHVVKDFPYTRAASRAQEEARGLLLEELLHLGSLAAIDFSAAEREIRRLDDPPPPFPDELRRIWADGRDRILRSISQGRGVTGG